MTEEDHERLRDAFIGAFYRRDPCWTCGAIYQEGQGRYPTCDGMCLCRECYEAAGRPVSQIYPGDLGYGLPTQERSNDGRSET